MRCQANIRFRMTQAVQIRQKPVGSLGITARRLLGAGFVPEERHGHAAVSAMSLVGQSGSGASSAPIERPFIGGGFARHYPPAAVKTATKRISEAMDVRKSGEDPAAGSLSGGNLQKFIVGRELDRQPTVLVVNQPTWGVDAGAASRIRQALVDLAQIRLRSPRHQPGSRRDLRSGDGNRRDFSEGRLSDAYPASERCRAKRSDS